MSYTFILSNGNSNLEFVFDPTFLTIKFYIIQYTKTTFNIDRFPDIRMKQNM